MIHLPVDCVVIQAKQLVIKLAQGVYKRKHDNVAGMVYWKLYEKLNFEKPEKW